MTVIKQEDFIQSIADAFQFISYYHPVDYIKALSKAWEKEENPAAKDAMTQILVNSRMCAEGHRPICQDTGIATVFLKVGMNVQWDAQMSVQEMVNEGVRRAYTNPDNKLRASVLADPAGKRQNTKDNTPAVVHMEIVAGDKIEVTCAAKGGGSENKSKMAMLNPSDSIVDWVLKTVPTMGAGWCPPGILGIGIGGTPEKAALLAKESLMSHIDIHELQEKAASGAELSTVEALRLELFEKVNALGIGAQGLGGLTTVLDVKILDYPTHAASKPVAMIPNCAATRMDKFTRQMLEQTGLLGMIGKSERGAAACQAIADNKAVYLMAVGGSAYLVAKAIKQAKVVAFADLGMEAIYEFEVKDMPVTVAVDAAGQSVHAVAPKQWQAKIGIIPVEA